MEFKNVFVNMETYDFIIKELGYEPENLGINNALVDSQAIALNEEEYLKLYYPLIKRKSNY